MNHLKLLSFLFFSTSIFTIADTSTFVQPKFETLTSVEDPFLMSIEEANWEEGEGTIISGYIERGEIKVGEMVEIMGFGFTSLVIISSMKIDDIEVEMAEEDDDVILVVQGIDKKEIKEGMVLASPGSISLSKIFEAKIFMLPKDNGGRHEPFYDDYSPVFNIRTVDINGVVKLMNDIKEVNPGDQTEVKIELEVSMPVEIGLMFSIRENGKTIGAGSVTKIL